MQRRAPLLPAIVTPGSLTLVDEARFEALHVIEQDVSEQTAKSVAIHEARLDKVLFTGAGLEKLDMQDVMIKGGDWSGAHCASGGWLRVACNSVRMAGIDLSECTVKDVIFSGCRLDLANFRNTTLTRVQFIDCTLVETDFQNATLQHVSFAQSVLDKTEFSQVKATHLDFREAQLLEVRGWQYLKNAQLDNVQLMAVAPQLAAALGLKID